MALARFCDAKLKEVGKSVELVLKESGEEWKTVPFESGQLAGDESEDADDDDRG
jgi:exonuclease VII small subunit